MGCASSKMGREDRRKEREIEISGRVDLSNHIVSLTSSTYGVLKLDREAPADPPPEEQRRIPVVHPTCEEPEIINAWELMEDLDDEIQEKKPPPPKIKQKIPPPGKENLQKKEPQSLDLDPRRVLQPLKSPSPNPKINRKSFNRGSPLFDPELVAFFEKEHSEKKRIPPGGEEAVVLYTTSLRGIRKTFDDCSDVRAMIESHGVRIVERDISMDSGFREELRWVMGKREIRVPMLFVRGKFVGGAEEVKKMEEEGRLEKMLAGIPVAGGWCDGCGGMRFVLCMDCSGSRKVFVEGEKKTVRCGECNENGLILCPICG